MRVDAAEFVPSSAWKNDASHRANGEAACLICFGAPQMLLGIWLNCTIHTRKNTGRKNVFSVYKIKKFM